MNSSAMEVELPRKQPHVVVVGAGFTGLAAAYELCLQGAQVTLVEREGTAGGLAGTFATEGEPLEKFYHHWFLSDTDVFELAHELGVHDSIIRRGTASATWYANQLFNLSRPVDLLRFRALSPLGRLRLGYLAHKAHHTVPESVTHIPAGRWLRQCAGDEVFRVVWEPLLRGKFGRYADEVSAAWMVSKLQLRGGSRQRGREALAYYRGGFSRFADRILEAITTMGGRVLLGTEVTGLQIGNGRLIGARIGDSVLHADAAIVTTAAPIAAKWLMPHDMPVATQLAGVPYLVNVCLVMILRRSLSRTYWMNVNDPGYPFVAVVEHTNFEPSSSYAGKHVVYLSRYTTTDDPSWSASDSTIADDWLGHLARIFPAFDRTWIDAWHVWRARYAQPVITTAYASMRPPLRPSVPGIYLASMAQIYPEDRGTNYAIRAGREAARAVVSDLRADS